MQYTERFFKHTPSIYLFNNTFIQFLILSIPTEDHIFKFLIILYYSSDPNAVRHKHIILTRYIDSNYPSCFQYCFCLSFNYSLNNNIIY